MIFKHIIFAIYIFSVFYCYVEVHGAIAKAMNRFIERHPNLPIIESGFWGTLKVDLEVLLVSAIPIINIALGFMMSNAPSSFIDEVVNSVESSHWLEISECERSMEELGGSNRQESVASND